MQRLGRYAASSQVVGALRNASVATGIGFDVLAAKAAVESGFRPDAQAKGSSARGLFQFIDQTWLDMVQRKGADHGLGEEAAAITRGAGGRLTVADPAARSRILALRDDPEVSARMAGEYLHEVSDALTPTLGRRPDAAELYLGHFLGPNGARQVLQGLANDPTQAASAVVPDAAAANPTLFRSADGRPLSLAGFMEGIRTRLNRTYAEIGATPPSGPVTFPTKTAQAGRGLEGSAAGTAGSSAPTRVAHAPEQAMVSTLARVFSRMGRTGSGHHLNRGNQTLPPEILAAMRNDRRDSNPAGGART
jgi:hypothetical protein